MMVLGKEFMSIRQMFNTPCVHFMTKQHWAMLVRFSILQIASGKGCSSIFSNVRRLKILPSSR